MSATGRPTPAIEGVLGWRCAVCATTIDVSTPYPFVCPVASAGDRHHVLHPLTSESSARLDDPNPFVAYGSRMAWWAFAASHGMTESAIVALAREVADGFVVTPCDRHDLDLAERAGGGAGTTPVWIKDETSNVAGSHKARHLVGIMLHLRAAELLRLAPTGPRAPLAIASCGNAAIAAATLAQRAEWPLQVYVPEWASPSVLSLLEHLGATITVTARSPDDPPGDPTVARFREAVAGGAVPFGVQGPENALCLDGGRTIGWELADAFAGGDAAPHPLDRVVVQVGGGAFAACTGWGLGPTVRLDTVQTQGCAPLARAWWRARDAGMSEQEVSRRWSQLMTPWRQPHSVADGILDDETYDWLGDFSVMAASGGRPLVVPEEAVARAVEIAATTGIPVSATGAAGLAGLLMVEGRVAAGEHIAVVFSGVARP